MTFDRPDLLWLMFALPLVVAVGVLLFVRRRRHVVRAIGDAALLERLGGAGLLSFPWRRLLLVAIGAASLGFAASGPRWGSTDSPTESRALNLVLAMDISKSMLAEDVSPNRLERARLLARRLMRELRTDRIGLVVFAGRAYVLSPLTTDHGALDLYIDALDPGIVSQGGSSLAAAIAQATDLARGREDTGGDRAVVLITDGEALEERAAVLDAAERARRSGVRVYTVGVGTEQGAPVPEFDPASEDLRGYKRHESGEIVISQLGEDLLRDVARAADGSYYALGDAGAVGSLVGELQELQRSASQGARRTTRREQYAWFVALALILLALDAWLSRARSDTARLNVEGDEAAAPKPRVRRPRRRRRAVMETAVVLMLCLLGTGFGVGDLERGNRLYRDGRYEEAVAAYRSALEDGDGTPELHYNLGTALLALGRYTEAERHLQLALRDVEPELRQRAYYNLGNRYLRAARENTDARAQVPQLEAAIEAYKRALRLAPEDLDAKWNLELAQRKRDEQQQRPQPQQQQQDEQQDQQQQEEQQARNQSGAQPSQEQTGQDAESGSRFEQQPMTRAQAEQILAAVEQDERELTRETLRKGQRRTPVARDW